MHITTPAEIAALRADGWEVPDLPRSQSEALARHSQLQKQNTQATREAPTHITAQMHLDERLSRNPYSIESSTEREKWYIDGIEGSFPPRRHSGAATVNGMLGGAIIPPFGYTGNIKDLVSEDLLQKEEVEAARASEEAIRELERRHDEEWKKRYGDGSGENERRGWGVLETAWGRKSWEGILVLLRK